MSGATGMRATKRRAGGSVAGGVGKGSPAPPDKEEGAAMIVTVQRKKLKGSLGTKSCQPPPPDLKIERARSEEGKFVMSAESQLPESQSGKQSRNRVSGRT